MTTGNHTHCEDNVARLNAFLDQLPDSGLDPDFDDTAEYLDHEFAGLRLNVDPD
jgi:hypothetical protein